MPKIVIDKERCKACELCITYCNQECLALGQDMNAAGYFAATFVNQEKCKGCALCAEMCPDMAIQVWK
jgi:2-oxoglutarate ferredoxin oxidoreductase subunit delta